MLAIRGVNFHRNQNHTVRSNTDKCPVSFTAYRKKTNCFKADKTIKYLYRQALEYVIKPAKIEFESLIKKSWDYTMGLLKDSGFASLTGEGSSASWIKGLNFSKKALVKQTADGRTVWLGEMPINNRLNAICIRVAKKTGITDLSASTDYNQYVISRLIVNVGTENSDMPKQGFIAIKPDQFRVVNEEISAIKRKLEDYFKLYLKPEQFEPPAKVGKTCIKSKYKRRKPLIKHEQTGPASPKLLASKSPAAESSDALKEAIIEKNSPAGTLSTQSDSAVKPLAMETSHEIALRAKILRLSTPLPSDDAKALFEKRHRGTDAVSKSMPSDSGSKRGLLRKSPFERGIGRMTYGR